MHLALKNFETTARTDIGRYLDRSNNEPSLCSGETLAVFQRSGKTPEEMLRLKTAVKDGEIDEAAIFRKKLLRSSSPVALLVDSWATGKPSKNTLYFELSCSYLKNEHGDPPFLLLKSD